MENLVEYEVSILKNGRITSKFYKTFREALHHYKEAEWLHHHYGSPNKGILVKWINTFPAKSMRDFGF